MTMTNTMTNGTRANGNLTTRELEESVGTLPVLGYSVQWNLLHIEIAHHDLVKALHKVGFTTTGPERPTPTTALRRALVKWLHNQAVTSCLLELDTALEFEIDDAGDIGEDTNQSKGKGHNRARKNLIRKINSPQSDWLVFGLVVEHLDLAALGLSYATQLRVFLHKKTHDIRLSYSQLGFEPDEPDTDKLDTEEGGSSLTTVNAEIQQLFHYYREHHQSRDISMLLRQVVNGLDSFSLRRLGGVYFVPGHHRARLDGLRKLVDDLPATAGYVSDKFLLMLPILDGAGAKKQLAGAAHRDFMSELAGMQSDLERLVEEAESHKLRTDTVARRLTAYRELKSKAEVYAELLDMQGEKILLTLEKLTREAAQLLDSVSDPNPEPLAHQQAFDWDTLHHVDGQTS
ncbi:MAG TPA: DUF6744 family protein [Chloroflexia bacterium]|nr:DUF6744 family protein [Chloroflexia bacterium]